MPVDAFLLHYSLAFSLFIYIFVVSIINQIWTMEPKKFFHVCANGADARNFIVSKRDYYAAFNLIGVCAANTNVVVISYSIEDSHPHILLWGTEADCEAFRKLFENLYRRYAAATRPHGADFILHCELYPIDSEEYLLNVAIYTIIQPTKDGKPVMYHDYRWGTGSLYFRNEYYTPVWYYSENGEIVKPVRFGDLGSAEKREILHSRSYTIPDDWLVCNGFILPSNYVDVKRFEGIYKTHNRFRVFLSSTKAREEQMQLKMVEWHGAAVEDQEARALCGNVCKQLYGTRDPRRLNTVQRINVAQLLRKDYRMTIRQLATLVRLDEAEIRANVRR